MVNNASSLLADLVDRFRRYGSKPWRAILAGGVIVFLWAWWANNSTLLGPIVAVDGDQQRADTVLPAPRGGMRIQQSFYPRWNGLREIELILARPGEPDQAENGSLLIQLLDDAGGVVAEQSLETRTISHNQVYKLRFAPQGNSAGRRYLLQLSGNDENPVSLWGYNLDVDGRGQLTVEGGALASEPPETAAKELRFVTRYQLTWRDAFFSLGATLYWEGALLLLASLVIPLPGMLILLLGVSRARRWDAAAWWGTALSLGVATWPLLWFGLTLIGGRWRSWSLWMIIVAGWVAAILLWLHRIGLLPLRQHLPGQEPDQNGGPGQRRAVHLSSWKQQHSLLLVLLFLALAVRLLAVRDLVFPPWVDAGRHALITAVMVENGRAPSDYLPYLPVERFPYHFGFHTLSATLGVMTNWPLHRLLLFLGQWLNGLLPLTVYAAVWLLTRQRNAGVVAAFLVAIPFFFPAYYVTWGRLTQLAAMLIMPVLLAFTWLLIRGGRQWRRLWWLVSILVAGLFLVHFRVFLFYLPFAAFVWLISLGRNSRKLAYSAALALLLAGGRMAQLLSMTDPGRAISNTMPNYNAFPTSYVQTGWERIFLGMAAVAWLLTLLPALKQRRWTTLPLALAGWVALLFMALAGERLGLPETTLVNVNSMYITLFLPLAIFLGVIFDQLWRWLSAGHWSFRLAGNAALGGALTAGLLFGVRQQIAILNPQTILVRWQDLAGLEWARDHLTGDDTVAVNSWRWLGNTWAGSDGGAWLVPLAAVRSTTPPVDYIYNPQLFRQVIAFNEAATAVTDWSAADAAGWLRQQGVSHVFVGHRGGFLDPAALARNPGLQMVYSGDGVFIFAVR